MIKTYTFCATQNTSKSCYEYLEILHVDFLLTGRLMLSDKNNSMAMGLIFFTASHPFSLLEYYGMCIQSRVNNSGLTLVYRRFTFVVLKDNARCRLLVVEYSFPITTTCFFQRCLLQCSLYSNTVLQVKHTAYIWCHSFF